MCKLLLVRFRAAVAALEATMNFNIDLCANSDKKITSNASLRSNIPKSISCHQINLSDEMNDTDHLEDEDSIQQTYLENQVCHQEF